MNVDKIYIRMEKNDKVIELDETTLLSIDLRVHRPTRGGPLSVTVSGETTPEAFMWHPAVQTPSRARIVAPESEVAPMAGIAGGINWDASFTADQQARTIISIMSVQIEMMQRRIAELESRRVGSP